ncbi:maltose alpha-D-glucosyltransferase [Actinoplanes oblitus]|uniref:maltose alpha-D-glucosyltransferase n=1 Tax=Actinoplanes oblitus TaxID=3040509 RepID=A0ABY8W4P9_9ACTN|nr:maltose alpha-D-glucosyltransferase [Actinoplanes oblitus]WIM92829.1 maltose alpha-D-glucosyltransferase [Actinoplanes oblitus]
MREIPFRNHSEEGLPAHVVGGDPDWYRRCVVYEVLVQAFQDSDGDGIGDLAGLTQRLDYLAWLGIDCLWLPPFYASPMRDGGYDVSDFLQVRPELGTLDDFRALLRQAHRRGIRVIVDMVLNHTSEEHPWFQASRCDPDGPYGDFYVWADDDSGYPDARIIFTDTQTSNWAYDPVRRRYFWHRFYRWQPDLNYANPAVRAAVLDVMRYWLDLGVDGLRLDAVPYLFEAEGTNCENLPETHEFLRACRRLVDQEYPGRILLAEANQPLPQVIDYFGAVGAEECHMAFHFPLMPRMFAALRRQDATPVAQIISETSPLPSGGQWALFLRNHDELTLEMVTDEERAFLLERYAYHPRMTANIGIRRRLAPLLDNDHDALKLMNALLLALPGTPILYYGDEIGMGDNIWLEDRDGVRCPMQWSGDAHAGFSTRDPDESYLPLVDAPEFHAATVNVEYQLRDPDSLLHWMRHMIRIRHRFADVFGQGELIQIPTGNRAVLAFVRRRPGAEESVLCVNSLSAHPQEVRLELPEQARGALVNLAGSGPQRLVTEGPVRLRLPGCGFIWFAATPLPPDRRVTAGRPDVLPAGAW